MDITTVSFMTFTDTTNVSTNMTSSNVTVQRDESLARVEIVVQSVILVLAVLGNSIVLAALFVRRRALTRMHVLMIHLSGADLFVAFCSVLPQLAWDVTFVFKGGDFVCRLVKYMQVVAIYASSYVLLTTAIDRYLAICHPLLGKKMPSNMVHRFVLVAWALSLVFSVPQILIFSYKVNFYGLPDCWATFDPPWTMPLYITTFTCLVYIIPTIILVFCYSSICLAVWRSGKANMKQGTPLSKYKTSHETTPPLMCSTSDHNNRVFRADNMQNDTHENRLASDNCSNTLRTATSKNNGRFVTKSRSLDSDDDDDNEHGHSRSLEILHEINSCTQKHNGANRQQTEINNAGKRTTTYVSRGRISHLQCATKRPRGSGISRAKIKTIKLTMTVVICYLACWSPFFIAQMWAVYDVNAPFNGSAYTIILLLASLNSCTNPWIYLIYSDIFFTCFKGLFAKLPCK